MYTKIARNESGFGLIMLFGIMSIVTILGLQIQQMFETATKQQNTLLAQVSLLPEYSRYAAEWEVEARCTPKVEAGGSGTHYASVPFGQGNAPASFINSATVLSGLLHSARYVGRVVTGGANQGLLIAQLDYVTPLVMPNSFGVFLPTSPYGSDKLYMGKRQTIYAVMMWPVIRRLKECISRARALAEIAAGPPLGSGGILFYEIDYASLVAGDGVLGNEDVAAITMVENLPFPTL